MRIIQNSSVVVNDDGVFINGENFNAPSGSGNIVVINGTKIHAPSGNGMNITQVGKKLYVNGFEYKDGKWKRTLAALWHYMF